MRTLLALSLLFTSGLCRAGDILPYDRLSKENVRVSAHALSSGSSKFVNWSASWGSDVDITQRKLIDITVSGIGNSGAPVEIEFFQVLKDGNNQKFVKSEGKDIKSGGSGNWGVLLIAERNETRLGGVTETTGGRMVGWFVRAIRNNRVVGFAASPSTFEQYAEDPARIK